MVKRKKKQSDEIDWFEIYQYATSIAGMSLMKGAAKARIKRYTLAILKELKKKE